jgi:hypothetical protein
MLLYAVTLILKWVVALILLVVININVKIMVEEVFIVSPELLIQDANTRILFGHIV